jgi:hypothetical protein
MRRRKRMLDELDLDICDYIARETQDNIDRGMSPEEARYTAMRKFGIREDCINTLIVASDDNRHPPVGG